MTQRDEASAVMPTSRQQGEANVRRVHPPDSGYFPRNRSSPTAESLSGGFSFKLVVQPKDAVVPVLVFAEFRLCDDAKDLLLQNTQLQIEKLHQFVTKVREVGG